MNRRNFISLLGSGIFVPLIEPRITYILPPVCGWDMRRSRIRTNFATLLAPGIKQIYYDYLLDEGILTNPNLNIEELKEKYLNERAYKNNVLYLKSR